MHTEGSERMDWVTILVSIITAGFAFLGVYTSNRKQAALVAYRLESRMDIIEKSITKGEKAI